MGTTSERDVVQKCTKPSERALQSPSNIETIGVDYQFFADVVFHSYFNIDPISNTLRYDTEILELA